MGDGKVKDVGDGEGEPQPAETTKKAGASASVVLSVEMHCDGCALKVKKAINGTPGVEVVGLDLAGGTVTVSGNADPWELKGRIEARAHKPVSFLSPPNPPPPKKLDANANAAKKKKKIKDQADPDPPESTVVLKMGLHCNCNGCIDRIKRAASRVKGVKKASVAVDTAKEHVTATVRGTMDADALRAILKSKLKRDVALVPPATADKGKKNRVATASGRKKEEEAPNQREAGVGDKNERMTMTTVFESKAMLYGDAGEGLSSSWYGVETPQLFSDENPNACSLM